MIHIVTKALRNYLTFLKHVTVSFFIPIVIIAVATKYV